MDCFYDFEYFQNLLHLRYIYNWIISINKKNKKVKIWFKHSKCLYKKLSHNSLLFNLKSQIKCQIIAKNSNIFNFSFIGYVQNIYR